MNFYRLKLDVKLDENKVTEPKFYKIVDKFFNKLANLKGVKSPEKTFVQHKWKEVNDRYFGSDWRKIFLRFIITQLD